MKDPVHRHKFVNTIQGTKGLYGIYMSSACFMLMVPDWSLEGWGHH